MSRTAEPVGASDLIDGASLLASTANVVMQRLGTALRIAFGPVNQFLTAGFLPPLFREQMQVCWTEREQRRFGYLMRLVASVDHLLPGPVSRFPFNACLRAYRLRMMIT